MTVVRGIMADRWVAPLPNPRSAKMCQVFLVFYFDAASPFKKSVSSRKFVGGNMGKDGRQVERLRFELANYQ